MKIAVTGASGFLGKAAVNRLAEKGHQVIALGRNLEVLRNFFQNYVICHESDYRQGHLEGVLQNADAILHLAARRFAPLEEGLAPFLKDNIQTTENLLQAATKAGVKKFCMASSISVYSPSDPAPFREDQAPQPGNFYGLSKLICENLLRLYEKISPIHGVILRFGKIFGNDDRSGRLFLPYVFIDRAVKKEVLPVWGKGAGVRDLIYIEDAVDAVEKALQPQVASNLFNIGGGKPVSFLEIAETVNRVFENVDNLSFDRSKNEDDRGSYMDCSRAEAVLKWNAKWSLERGLEAMKLLKAPEEWT